MLAAIPLKRSEMKRLADFAKKEGVRAEIEFGADGKFTFRVSPDHAPAKVDDTEESALDRELEEFDRKNGYS